MINNIDVESVRQPCLYVVSFSLLAFRQKKCTVRKLMSIFGVCFTGSVCALVGVYKEKPDL